MRSLGRVLRVCLFLLSATGAWAYQPVLISFVVDASASVSQADFRVANEALVAYVNQIRARTLIHSDVPSSIALVDYFGGPDEGLRGPSALIADLPSVAAMTRSLEDLPHPSYGSTAIYSGLRRSLERAARAEELMDYDFRNVVIVITDGADNASSASDRRFIQGRFPREDTVLFVLGVGPDAVLGEFDGVADGVSFVDGFRRLELALVALPNVLE